MKIAAASVDDYLARVPTEHRQALARVRDVMRRNLPPGYEEGLLFGMISWYVPPGRLGHTYNGQPLMIASLASQKNYMALYLLNVYGNPDVYPWFTSAFAAAGKKLDMGKSCVRFRSLDDLPLDVIGKVAGLTSVDAHVAQYQAAQGSRKQKPVVLPGRPAKAPSKPATKAAAGKAKAAAGKAKAAAGKAKVSAGKAKAAAGKVKVGASKTKAGAGKGNAKQVKAPAKKKPSPRRGR